MNREIKFKYVLQHGETGRICALLLSLERIEEGGLIEILSKLTGYSIIAKCEFVGLKDKNGKEIYEGDIVRILYSDWISKSDKDPRTIEQYKNDIAEIKVVQWHFNGFYVSSRIDGWNEDLDYGRHGFIEVIGNIFETPHLLNSEKNAQVSDTTEAQ